MNSDIKHRNHGGARLRVTTDGELTRQASTYEAQKTLHMSGHSMKAA